jgi:uncharacterized protein (TIGR02300 family)
LSAARARRALHPRIVCVAKPELGAKRQCLNCGTKFFDFAKDPILCPKCGTVFQAAPLSRAAARAAAAAEEDEVDTDAAGAEVVSLEEAAVDEDKGVAVDDDVEVEDDAVADDTFLEEEEGDADDVADLIDGEIEDDEET